MKKVFAFLLLLSLCFSLVSCGGKKSDTFRVGVLQFAPHPALDAATEGFQDALKEKLGSF